MNYKIENYFIKKSNLNNLLFIFEMANNHMGSLDHGLKIIREFYKVIKSFNFKFGFKLQYRDIDTFIHPDYKERTDIKYIKRFLETRMSKKQFKILKNEINNLGFISICTPFDEISVDPIEDHDYDIVKIGSCSFTDWPLLERIVKMDKPIIASTAGATLEDIDKVVSFLEHRNKIFALMHCVAEYPTHGNNLQLNQIDLLRSRYPHINIGYSTHEDPNNFESIKIAIAKGATIFEKHVGIKNKKFSLNDYSTTPEQAYNWLKSAEEALKMCGVIKYRPKFSKKELSSLKSLRRGVFAKRKIIEGKIIKLSDTFLGIPTVKNQITANDMSKYTEFYAKKEIGIKEPIILSDIKQINYRDQVYKAVQKIKEVLKKSRVLVPDRLDFEISHHYGIKDFNKYGMTMISFVNREYCKKLLILLPGQEHPEQYHKIKEETFHVLYGDIYLNLDGVEKECKAGDLITIEKGTKHKFTTKNGAVIEEISTSHYIDDSYYSDNKITENKNRKTLITYWKD